MCYETLTLVPVPCPLSSTEQIFQYQTPFPQQVFKLLLKSVNLAINKSVFSDNSLSDNYDNYQVLLDLRDTELTY